MSKFNLLIAKILIHYTPVLMRDKSVGCVVVEHSNNKIDILKWMLLEKIKQCAS